MAVVFLDIHDAQDPNGSVLATLTDEDVSAFEMRCGENELGSGTFTIRRDHASATEANLATGNYVKVRIPLIQDEPVFGFWLDEHDDTLIATDEEGNEYLTRKGWGPLFIYAHARLLDDFYNGPLGGQDRGSFTVPGYWTWRNEPYGAIMVRLTEEGQLQPGFPLGEVNIDWNRVLDSDGNAWPTVTEELQFPIGVDGLTVMQALVDSGELFLRADADLSVHGYGTRGTDRTNSTYATNKVRFVKGENILTGLERSGKGNMAATHAIVVGKDNTYDQAVSPDYVPGTTGRWTTVNYGESNDLTLLEKVGQEDLRKRNAQQEGLELEFFAGDDEATGRYLPFKHFNTGDRVTLHTGSAEWDYTNAPHYVIGFRIVLGEASKDDTEEETARSLRWVVELNAGGRYSASIAQAAGATGQVCSDCGLRLCHDEAIPPGEGSLYMALDNGFHPAGDGSIVYVNGVAIAIGSGGDPSDRNDRWEIPDGTLVAGDNVIAVGIENGVSPGSWWGGNFTAVIIRAYVGTDDSGPAIAWTDTSTKILPVENLGGTLGGEPGAGWEDIAFDDSGWDNAIDVGGFPASTSATLDGTFPPTSPSQWVGPAGAPGSDTGNIYPQGLKWYARITFSTGVSSSIVGGPGATSGTSTRAAPCDHHHAYTADDISYGGGTVADALDAGGSAAHEADTSDAHDASAISFSPTGTIAATDVQAAIAETSGDVTTVSGAVSAHLADTADAHDASAISFVPTGTIAATDVQAAIAEVAAEAGTASALDDLTDVVITSPAEDDTLRYISGSWVNDNRRWEAVTDGEDVFVWDGDDLVHEWKVY